MTVIKQTLRDQVHPIPKKTTHPSTSEEWLPLSTEAGLPSSMQSCDKRYWVYFKVFSLLQTIILQLRWPQVTLFWLRFLLVHTNHTPQKLKSSDATHQMWDKMNTYKSKDQGNNLCSGQHVKLWFQYVSDLVMFLSASYQKREFSFRTPQRFFAENRTIRKESRKQHIWSLRGG